MIQKVPDMPSGCLGFEAIGEVDANDYRETLIPAVDRKLAEGGRIRFLYLIGSRFDRYSGEAAWEDAKLGVEHFTNWERCAVVTDLDWMDHLVRGFGWMMPGRFRVFPTSELEAAKSWLAEA